MWIKKLKTSNFRNLQQVDLTLPGPGVYVLYGHNGAGKTNILEVISLLSPGQGLHRDKLENMLPDLHEADKATQWGFYGEVQKEDQGHTVIHTVGMGYDKKKRIIKVDGEETAGQAELANLGAVLWFTPEMDRLFFGSPSGRRRFYDRLVFGLHPQHAAMLSRYTKHLQSRMQLLKDPQADPDWVALEEQQAAKYGEAVVKARLAYLDELKPYLDGVELTLNGNAERTYLEALETEANPAQAFATEYAERRPRDARQKSNSFGPQRTDLGGTLTLEDGMPVPLERTSMGQHKKALIKLLIGAARLQHEKTGHPPCILLDEIATHLDEEARGLLYEKLLPLGGQLWLTGTEKSQFTGLEGAHFIKIKGGIATPEFNL